eukprot:7553372-Alexandrium_andersonii.AAC.1
MPGQLPICSGALSPGSSSQLEQFLEQAWRSLEQLGAAWSSLEHSGAFRCCLWSSLEQFGAFWRISELFGA